jgi:hypothetical protein
MGWMQDRDLLIAEALAFVKEVRGPQAEIPAPAQSVPIEKIRPIGPPEVTSYDPLEFERMTSLPPRNERDEIAARLASFKATQLRFQREREWYGSATLREAVNGADAPANPAVGSTKPN